MDEDESTQRLMLTPESDTVDLTWPPEEIGSEEEDSPKYINFDEVGPGVTKRGEPEGRRKDAFGRQRDEDSRMSLRTSIRMPARFREEDESTLEHISQAVSQVSKDRRTSIDRQQLPRLDTLGSTGARSRGRPRVRHSTSPTPSRPKSRFHKKKLPPAAFPSLEPSTLPPTVDEKRKRALHDWAVQDDEWGRWGEDWSEVGPYAEEEEVIRAVQARAKRACYWDKKTVAQWYHDEMLEQSKRPQGQMNLTRRGNIIHVLRTNWMNIARTVFGEDPLHLEEKMQRIYVSFWN